MRVHSQYPCPPHPERNFFRRQQNQEKQHNFRAASGNGSYGKRHELPWHRVMLGAVA